MENEKIKLNRTYNTIRNIIFGTVNKVVTMFLPFLLRTVLIQVLGMEYVGLNGLFTSVLQVLNLSELGLSTAIVYCMYKPIAEDDQKTICALLKLLRKVYFIIGMIVLILGVCLVPCLRFFIKGSYPSSINLYLLYAIYLVDCSISYLFGGYKNVILWAHQRADVTQNIMSVVKGLMYIIQIIIIMWTRNYYLYAVMLPIFTLLINLITVAITDKLYPQYVCCGEVPLKVKYDLKEKISGLIIAKFCDITRNGFDNIFVSAYLGLTIVALYENYYYIMKSLMSILGIIVQAILAGVGNSMQTESLEQNYRDFKRFNFMYLWISGVCTICLLCLYQPFMELWVGKDNLLPISSVVLLCMYFFLNAMGDMQGVYYYAAGLWWYYRKSKIVESFLNLVLNGVLGKIWGLNGIIAGTLISMFLINFLYSGRFVFKYYFKNDKATAYYLSQIKYAIITALVSAFIYGCCSGIDMSLYKMTKGNILFVRGLICLLLSNIFFIMIYKNSEEFISTKKWIAEKTKMRKFNQDPNA